LQATTSRKRPPPLLELKVDHLTDNKAGIG